MDTLVYPRIFRYYRHVVYLATWVGGLAPWLAHRWRTLTWGAWVLSKKKIRSLLRRASAGARAPLLHPAYYTALSRSPGRALLTGRCVWGGKGEEMGEGGCRPAMGLFVCVGVLGLGLYGSAL